MFNYKVVEIFESINGEGKKAGQLALFIRFQKCNLNCSYCDTKWGISYIWNVVPESVEICL